MSGAIAYKLPPLPAHVGEESHGPSQQPVKLYDGEQIQAYAIAAIEAQGVPEHCGPSCTSYELASMVMSDCGHSTNNQRLLDRIAERISKHVEALLASAPPALQAEDNWRQYATEREDTAQAVIERHRKEHESLLRLLAIDRQTIADMKASKAQQEPIYQLKTASGAWVDQSEQSYQYNLKSFPDLVRVVYTNPAPQAKPQPRKVRHERD